MIPSLLIIGRLAISDFKSKKNLSQLIGLISMNRLSEGFNEDILIFFLRKEFSFSAYGFLEIGFASMAGVS